MAGSVATKISIEFQRVGFRAKDKKETKQIIKGVSGKFKSGELTAIMGPSGAGKTSLLNVLTGFQISGTEGTIKCSSPNNNPKGGKKGALQYKKECCYILQDDQLSPFFTVGEIMRIAANLKLGNASEKSKDFLIQDILKTLGLSMCVQTRCCRLSGGQKKRLSIALELLDNPPIMFLDEPTTGLDSSSSLQCVEVLKKLAAQGRTIICTIHQPSATIYEMFDHVYVMAAGKCVYQGSSINTVPYLASVGFNCPQYHNPADYLLEVANGEYGDHTDILAQAATEDLWRKPDRTVAGSEKAPLALSEDIYPIDCVQFNNYRPPSEFVKFFILLQRALLQIYRDWTISHLKLFLHTVVGIFLGIFYQNAGQDGSKAINNVGFLIISAVYLCYTSLMPAVLKFPSELSIIKKERFNNWYQLKTFYGAFLMADIPMQIIFAFAYTTTSYFISSQPFEVARYAKILGILILVSLTASSLGIVLGTLVNPINGTFLGAIITCLMLSVAGFLVIFTHMSKAMYLLTYISYLSFAMEAMVQALYGYDRAPLYCPDDVDYCHYRQPKQLLAEFGMEQDNFWLDVLYLGANFVVLRLVAYCTLRKQLSPK